MSHARVLGIVGLTALAAAAVAYAQTTVTPIPENAPVETAPLEQVAPAPEVTSWGDAQNGATIAGTCAACHGLDGNPTDMQYPRLAGQSERYIAHQIALFKSGERNDGMAAVMKPFADMLSAQDARDVGAYYATQQSGAGVADDGLVTEGPYEGMRFFEVGQQLYLSGDAERGIPSCMACHGPAGAGNPGPAYPRVAGQVSDYTQRRLEYFRSGDPENDSRLYRIMADVAAELTDQEIGALSSYLEGLHPAADDLVASAAGTAPVAAPAAAAPVDTGEEEIATTGEGEAESADAGADAEQPDEVATEVDATPDAQDPVTPPEQE